VSEIISEWWAISFRNRGRFKIGMVGDFARNQHYQAVETMPTDACQFFYNCKGCGERLKPLAGDCCVFCSYGSVPCPPIQTNLRCCVPKVH
jgi:hypothetical protein